MNAFEGQLMRLSEAPTSAMAHHYPPTHLCCSSLDWQRGRQRGSVEERRRLSGLPLFSSPLHFLFGLSSNLGGAETGIALGKPLHDWSSLASLDSISSLSERPTHVYSKEVPLCSMRRFLLDRRGGLKTVANQPASFPSQLFNLHFLEGAD